MVSRSIASTCVSTSDTSRAHREFVYYEQVIALCALRGFTPRIVQEAEETLTLLGLVATGFGLAFVPSGLIHITVPNLLFKPLSDEDATTEVCLGIRADDASATLTTFRRMAHAIRTRDRARG